MSIQELQSLYGTLPQASALVEFFKQKTFQSLFLEGLVGSSTPLLFSSIAEKLQRTVVFILNDSDEAGYFYHDLMQIMGPERVLFFPSSYRRAVKYGQRDHANEILRTEVLAKLSDLSGVLYIVTYPQAVAELVVSRKRLDDRMIRVQTEQTIQQTSMVQQLREFGFEETDYVYEPGQFAVRGSIIDVYSFSCEFPYRIDFFGDQIDTIRTFEVQDQLSKDKKSEIEIVPELSQIQSDKIPLLEFLPEDSILVMKSLSYIHDVIGQIYTDGFSSQALTERMEGATEQEQADILLDMKKENHLVTANRFLEDAVKFSRIEFGPHVSEEVKKQELNKHGESRSMTVLNFHVSPQLLFHKNFDLLTQTLEDYILKGYKLYILADSVKQTDRLHDIFADMDNPQAKSINFEPVDKTLHYGFADDDLKICLFTDHQIFDRFHKYSLRSDLARAGKMALTMKELQEMEPGDYVVHVDFGIGRFGGLVRVPLGNSYQEMIRIIYKNNDKVDVSIHSLYKISKYRSSDAG